ncbi:MAG TPA: hypothetical protein DIW27_04705 [Cytophagales bacterium]|nr:hypothetical protein [Cytophagales bacterium]
MWIILLATVPCCDEKDCLDDQMTEQSGHNEEAEACSPFLTCGTCTGLTFSNVTYAFVIPVVETDKSNTPFKISMGKHFIWKIWQPPKLV